MKRISKTIGAIALAAAGIMTAQAAPADPRPMQWPQSDGSTVILSLIGDEVFHCLMTPDGYVVTQGEDGFYYYVGNDGKTMLSRVSDGVPASLDKNVSFEAYRNANRNEAFLRRGNELNTRAMARVDKLGNSKWDNADGHDLREVKTEGELKVLILMVNFSDKKFSVSSDPHSLVNDMLNKPGFSEFNSSGSVLDYYQSISHGQFHPKFEVFGPVDLDKTSREYVSTDKTYIGPDGKETAVYAPGLMVEEACKKLDGQINFADYDSNNDGYVDFVYIFHAGKGATTGGNQATDIWPHAFTLNAAIGAPIELDGVLVNRYATSCEIGRQAGQLAGVGMICHEFSHVLGLPDLYDTANNGTVSKVFSPGTFSNMDAGNYNNDLHTPPMFSAYEQYALEWMLPVTITGSGNFTLLPSIARPFAYKINTRNNPKEYFLFEARAPYSWDEYLEGHGMLAWHIDFDLDIWNDNKPNNVASHQRIDLIEADDVQTATSRNGDPFPGTVGVHEYLNNGAPSFLDWSNSSTGYELYNIMTYPDGTVSFRVDAAKDMEGVELSAPVVNVTAVSSNSAKLNWAEVADADGYMVSVVDLDSFDGEFYRTFAEGWRYNDVKKSLSANVEGLKPGVNYGAIVYAYNDKNASRSDVPAAFLTQGATFAQAAPGIYAYKGEGSDTQLVWDAVADADSYELTVATRKAGETAETIKTGFDNSTLPEGWKLSGKYNTRDKNCGEAAPAVSLEVNGNYLRTATYERDIKEISFWAKKTFSDEGEKIEVYAYDEEGHVRLVATVGGFDTKGARYTVEIPAGYRQAMLRLSSSVSGLGLYIDDMEVLLADGPVDTPVSGYAARSVSDTQLAVSGLEPQTTYVAYVRPVKGEEKGKFSKAIEFVPSQLTAAGIEDLPVDSYEEAEVIVSGGVVSAFGQMMDVYTIDGARIARGTEITLPCRGLYIVRVNDASKKICW